MSSRAVSSRSRQIDQRIHLLYLAIIFGFIVIAGRAAWLQLYQHQEFRKLAAAQQKKLVSLAGKRGIITDRNGHNLALDVQAYAIYMDPEFMKDPPADIAAKLGPLVKQPVADLQANLSKKYWHYLARKQDEATMNQIKKLKLPGIGVVSESKRIYPHNDTAASLIGYTDIDNVGREGIEKSFNEYLQGGANKVSILTDAYGNELLRSDGNMPFLTEKAKANQVSLTIDENVQYIVERELKKGMGETQAKRGVAMVMDAENGDLLALATNPTVNLNEITQKGWDPKIKNWGVTDFYEPGSTMKIFTIAAALETGKTNVDDIVPTPGLIYVDKWPVHDHDMPAGVVRMLKPFQILEVSSNVGSSILGRRMTPAQHHHLLSQFGFGRKTHSNLNGEVGGILPPLPWGAARQSTISFGQGIAVTPLQLITAVSAMANKGVRVEPRIIQKITSPEGKVLKEFAPVKTRTLSAETADKVLTMMREVVESPHGTAHIAKIPGYQLGGKTGTADKVVNGRYNGDVMASFLGVLPADQPKYIIFVLFDAPQAAHFASMTAVPVFHDIAKNLITYFGLQPSKPEELDAYKVRKQ